MAGPGDDGEPGARQRRRERAARLREANRVALAVYDERRHVDGGERRAEVRPREDVEPGAECRRRRQRSPRPERDGSRRGRAIELVRQEHAVVELRGRPGGITLDLASERRERARGQAVRPASVFGETRGGRHEREPRHPAAEARHRGERDLRAERPAEDHGALDRAGVEGRDEVARELVEREGASVRRAPVTAQIGRERAAAGEYRGGERVEEPAARERPAVDRDEHRARAGVLAGERLWIDGGRHRAGGASIAAGEGVVNRGRKEG